MGNTRNKSNNDVIVTENFQDMIGWMPYSDAAKFFNYQPTIMSIISKDLIISKVRKRKFVLISSIVELLEKNVQ